MENTINQEPGLPQDMQSKKSYAGLWMAVAIVVMIVGGGAYVWQRLVVGPGISNPAQGYGVANWKTFTIADESGFGYVLKVPPEWKDEFFAGEGDRAYAAISKAFGPVPFRNEDYGVQIIHSGDSNPSTSIEEVIVLSRKFAATSTPIRMYNGKTIERFFFAAGEDTHAYLPSSKGIYDIRTVGRCSEECIAIYDSIVSTFKMLP